MTLLLLFISLISLYLILFEIYPVRRLRVKVSNSKPLQIPPVYLYSFQIHLHSQFSYDSLGKPEDIIKAAKDEDLDYIIVTDHDNDHIKYFAESSLIAGVEKKVLDQSGKILGDLLHIGDIKVVAHPFKEKYRWKLPLPQEYLFELIDLRDALLEKKTHLFFLMPGLLIRAVFSVNLALEALKRLIDIGRYAKLFLQMNISNQVVGGLDHHVKLYLREVGIRLLFPHYRHSFFIMRNFLLSQERIDSKESFLERLKEGRTIISFSKKPTIYWTEGKRVNILPPERCVLLRLCHHTEEYFLGSYFELEADSAPTFFLGYTYKLRAGSYFFGLKPLFIFLYKEEQDGRNAPSR